MGQEMKQVTGKGGQRRGVALGQGLRSHHSAASPRTGGSHQPGCLFPSWFEHGHALARGGEVTKSLHPNTASPSPTPWVISHSAFQSTLPRFFTLGALSFPLPSHTVLASWPALALTPHGVQAESRCLAQLCPRVPYFLRSPDFGRVPPPAHLY